MEIRKRLGGRRLNWIARIRRLRRRIRHRLRRVALFLHVERHGREVKFLPKAVSVQTPDPEKVAVYSDLMWRALAQEEQRFNALDSKGNAYLVLGGIELAALGVVLQFALSAPSPPRLSVVLLGLAFLAVVAELFCALRLFRPSRAWLPTPARDIYRPAHLEQHQGEDGGSVAAYHVFQAQYPMFNAVLASNTARARWIRYSHRAALLSLGLFTFAVLSIILQSI